MAYFIITSILLTGFPLAHLSSRFMLKRMQNRALIVAANAIYFFVFYYVYFFLAADLLWRTLGVSGWYDVELLLFLLFGLLSSGISSTLMCRELK